MTTDHLLTSFIEQRIREYVEPSKEGTPKGHRVGFSKPKFHASLLSALTSLKEKDIARQLKLSYGLLRKWHVEPDFKQILSAHIRDFAESFWDVIRTNARDTMIASLDKQSDTIPVSYSFRDGYGYSIAVAQKLCADAEQIADDAEKAVVEGKTLEPVFCAFEIWRCLPALRMSVASHTQELGRPKSLRHTAKTVSARLQKKPLTNSAEDIRQGFLRATQRLHEAITESLFEMLSRPEQRRAASAFRKMLGEERERRRSMQILF